MYLTNTYIILQQLNTVELRQGDEDLDFRSLLIWSVVRINPINT
jgi:hypothetical protein